MPLAQPLRAYFLAGYHGGMTGGGNTCSNAAVHWSSTAAPAPSCGGAACRSTRHAGAPSRRLTHYDQLRAIHADYIAAGADVITTNTFATTRFVLEAGGPRRRIPAINARAVAAAREARDTSGRDVAIAGSISCLPPRFDVHAYPDERAESAAYLELAETLAEAGVDLLDRSR